MIASDFNIISMSIEGDCVMIYHDDLSLTVYIKSSRLIWSDSVSCKLQCNSMYTEPKEWMSPYVGM